MIRRTAPVRSAKHGPESGFTLVELMVAITIGGLVATLLAASLRITLRFDDESARQAAERGDVMDRLRLQQFLGSALAAIPGTGVTEELTLHSGREQQRLTVWISPGAFDIPGEITDPCLLELRAGATPGLQLAIFPVDPVQSRPISGEADAGQTASSKPPSLLNQPIFAGMQRCVIDVLSTDGKWLSEWPDADRSGLPCAVRIRFTGTGSDNFGSVTAGDTPGTDATIRHCPDPGQSDLIIRLPTGNSCGGSGRSIETTVLPSRPCSGIGTHPPEGPAA